MKHPLPELTEGWAVARFLNIIDPEEGTVTDTVQAIRDAITATRPDASQAWDRFCNSGVEGDGVDHHWDIPRDVFNSLFHRFGEDHARTLLAQADRPHPGVAVWSQPRNGVDAWQRWLVQVGAG